jgi:inosine-uridine nucleoside N-ribohydrolase
MGGAIYTDGNLRGQQNAYYKANNRAEWNIFADVGAAARVFDASYQASNGQASHAAFEIFLVPLDTTNQLKLTRKLINHVKIGAELNDITCTMFPEKPCDKILQVVNDILQTPYVSMGVDQGWYYLWDPTTAVIATEELIGFPSHPVVKSTQRVAVSIDGTNNPATTASISPTTQQPANTILYADTVLPANEDQQLIDCFVR